MGYAFISYSTKNQQMADSFLTLFNQNGIETWMAPGDIPFGSTYTSTINRAIKGASCFVLLLSENAQGSPWVLKETERAVSTGKTIFTVMLDDVPLNDDFEFMLSTSQAVAIRKINKDDENIKRLLQSVITYTGELKAEKYAIAQVANVTDKLLEQLSPLEISEDNNIRSIIKNEDRGKTKREKTLLAENIDNELNIHQQVLIESSDYYIGKMLAGRYEIQKIIDQDGKAIIYGAFDWVDYRTVTVKIFQSEYFQSKYLENKDFKRRLENEFKAISVLSHRNIVKVLDFAFGNKIQYIVIEYVEGITLKEYIKKQKIIDCKEAIDIVAQILKALSHAHNKGVLHKDINPQNILLLPNATIKVTDFGIASFKRGEIKSPVETEALGSVYYVSPEQAQGNYTDERSDIYSVGIVLYEMLTGKPPFEGASDENIALMHVQRDPVKPSALNPSIPVGIEQITLRAMQKIPRDRYQTASEMLLDIGMLSEELAI